MWKILPILGIAASVCFISNCTTQTRVYSASVSPYGVGYSYTSFNNYSGNYSYYTSGPYAPPGDFYYPNYAYSGPFPYTSLTAYRRYDPYMFDPYSYGPGSYRTWAGYYPSW